MENGKKHEEAESSVSGSTDKLERQEHEGTQDNQYAEGQGEDENGQKPSADEQDK